MKDTTSEDGAAQTVRLTQQAWAEATVERAPYPTTPYREWLVRWSEPGARTTTDKTFRDWQRANFLVRDLRRYGAIVTVWRHDFPAWQREPSGLASDGPLIRKVVAPWPTR